MSSAKRPEDKKYGEKRPYSGHFDDVITSQSPWARQPGYVGFTKYWEKNVKNHDTAQVSCAKYEMLYLIIYRFIITKLYCHFEFVRKIALINNTRLSNIRTGLAILSVNNNYYYY